MTLMNDMFCGDHKKMYNTHMLKSNQNKENTKEESGTAITELNDSQGDEQAD